MKRSVLSFALLLALLLSACTQNATISTETDNSTKQYPDHSSLALPSSNYNFEPITPPKTDFDTTKITTVESQEEKFIIEYDFSLLYNNSVGSEWFCTVTKNGKSIASGDELSGSEGDQLQLTVKVVENDNIPDSAVKTVSLTLSEGASASEQLTVRENRGKYAGNTAKWEFTCNIHIK